MVGRTGRPCDEAVKAAEAKKRADAAARDDAETSEEEAAVLATFEFPDFDLPEIDKRAAGAALGRVVVVHSLIRSFIRSFVCLFVCLCIFYRKSCVTAV